MRTLVLCLAVLLSVVSAQGHAKFQLYFGCGYPNNGTNLLNGTTIQVCGFTPNSIITTPVTSGSCPSFVVTVESGNLPQGGADCTVTVSEGGLSTARLFQKALPNVTYNWTDLTAELAINIRDWNPWCAISPYGGYNGGKIAILADQGNGPSVFRQYSRKPNTCTPGGNTLVPWSGFPRLANGNIFGSGCDLVGGYYNTTVTVSILRTNAPINVYAEEYSDFRVFTQGLCDPQVYVVGHAPLTSYPSVSAPYSTFVPFDTNCSDGSCSSGLLISRLQIPNRCYEPPQSVFDPLNPIGQFVYLTDDNLTYTQFPRTTILLTWTPENNNQFTYRWSRGQENALIVEYTLAVNDIVVSSQWTDVPNNGNTPTLVVNGTFVKEPVAGCYSGYCEAQPITSTLHVDTQGFCDQIDTISVYQQQWNAPFGQVAPAFVNFRPNCSQLYNTNELLFCVWNNRNTRVSINYRTRGSTNIATVPSPSNDINCQVTLQKCDARGGLTPLCPNLGCLDDELGNGPTQLNVATALPQADGSNFLVDYFVTSPAALRNTSANGGCFWVPALSGLQLTISEGCCQYPLTPNGALSPQYNRGGFTGAGCVQYTSNTTDCTSATSCTTVEEFGRTLALFDLAYMPRDNGVSTTSVSLENPEDCSPFRFKTSQGGAPRCYCVLPINVKARIIETNLETTAQACKCTDTVSCVQRYESRDEDCTLCNWASDLTFDLRGLPWNTEVNLWVGSAPSFSPAAFKLLRHYTRGVGNVWNKLTVLRNGIQNNVSCSQEVGCADQWYCVESIDGAASLTYCVRCDTKICRTLAFTRDLCIDLENPCPNGTTNQLFDVVISRRDLARGPSISSWPASSSAPFVWSNFANLVRTVPRQGGVNGCSSPAPFKRELEPIPQEVMEAEELSQDQMMAMTEEDLLDYEARSQMHGVSKEEASRERLSFFNPANTGHYTVLRLDNYDVTLFEGNVRKTINVDCGGNSTTSCSPTNAPSLGYLNCLCWNTTCVGNAYNSTTGLNGGSIPSDNIWVTLGGNGQGIFGSPFPAIATNLTVLARHQIRGPRGFWTQNITTCEWSLLTFINATWQKAGNQNQCVPVIQSNSLSVTVEEGIIYSPTRVWPDPRGHPTITVPVNCLFNLTAYPSCSQITLDPLCYCYVRPNQIFSLWRILTYRGLDSATLAALVLKYTNPLQYFYSNQNVFREIPANATNYGSGMQVPNPQGWRVGDNFICVVADPYFGFSFNWGSFAFPLTNRPIYTPATVLSNSQFACPSDVAPRSTLSQGWGEDLNTCRHCETSIGDFPFGWNLFRIASGLSVFDRNWCRFAFIPPGSDFLNDYPLGDFVVFEFN